MNFKQFKEILDSISNSKYFLSVSFGCRVNSAETNQLSQILVDHSFVPSNSKNKPTLIIVNTCSITKKGEIESLSRVRILQKTYPEAKVIITGCANLQKLADLKNVYILTNSDKEKILSSHLSGYSYQIKDKFSHTDRFILKIQSGCNQFCTYCIVPSKRSEIWSLSVNDAINSVNQAVKDGYKEVIITGINLNIYYPGFSNLIEALLKETTISLISFGSVPLLCIDDKLIDLYKIYKSRLSHFLHIPLQSGSNKILKLMHRPYDRSKIIKTFNALQSNINNLNFGTDIIVGFPTETDKDFQETLELCQQIGFQKIHCFKYSSRPNTEAKILYESNPKIKKDILNERSRLIRNLV
jgi:threonylcarbamoyladenosine tRNA methylthiotransferase MtaB